MNHPKTLPHSCAIILSVFMAGCASDLPFKYTVVSIIPDEMKITTPGISKSTINTSGAKAYSVNEFGHVVGSYKSTWSYAEGIKNYIFIYADGKLTLYDTPCKEKIVPIDLIITNTKLISGNCEGDAAKHDASVDRTSFLMSYANPGSLQEIPVPWPQKGYVITDLKDNGDVIGYNFRNIYGYNKRDSKKQMNAVDHELVGFFYVSGKLRMVTHSEVRHSHAILNAKLHPNGLVTGGNTIADWDPMTGKTAEIGFFEFKDEKFDYTQPKRLKIDYSSGSGGFWLSKSKFGSGFQDDSNKPANYVDCKKDICNIYSINSQGWVLGSRFNTYAIPPMGASFGEHFLWIDGHFYSIDYATQKRIKSGFPIKLTNSGYVLFHSSLWPYLLAPVDLPATPPLNPATYSTNSQDAI